jgi:lipopolysaccharide heptosyltransferase II
MKILQILPELNVGGVETGTVDFARYLVEHKHESIVVSSGGRLVEQLIKDGSRHYTLPVNKKSLFTMIHSYRKLADILQKENVDVVHARSRVPAWIAYFASRKAKIPFITTCHGYYSNQPLSRVMGLSKLVIVISEVIARHMVHDFKVPSENIRLIPRSVDLQKFNVPRKTDATAPVIAIVGRISPIKGHEYFLRSIVKVVRSKPFCKIWIIGDAPASKPEYRQELEVLARRLGLRNHVEFLGNRSDIPQLLAQVDVLVMATVTQEAFGRVIIEAQAAGVPVVATKIGGIVEVIDHEKTGLLVLPKDTEAMADAVLRLLNEQKFAQGLIVNARKKIADKYTLKHMADATLKVYQELVTSLSILVVKLSAMGDVVLVTASLKALREQYPEAKIYCLVGRNSAILLQKCPYINGVIPFDLEKKSHISYLLSMAQDLRKYQFDKFIDFQNNRISHWLAFLSWPRESYGYDNGKWSWWLTDKIKNDQTSMGPVEHQFRLLKMLGISFNKNVQLGLWPSDMDFEHVQNLLDSEWLGHGKNIVGINLSASEKWVTKNWPIEHIARLCDLLATENIRVVLTGEQKDKTLVRQLTALTKSKPVNFVGKTNILQLAALIKKCRAYLTPDSAPMHLASAMGVPFVALFGPTDSVRHLPPSKKFAVIKKDLTCSPCYGTTCKITTQACMREITPDDVFRKIKELLA